MPSSEPLAAKTSESITPNDYGRFFVSPNDLLKLGQSRQFLFRVKATAPRRDPCATSRDLWLTRKNLARKAGIPEETRDRWQNDALQAVSTKHDDRSSKWRRVVVTAWEIPRARLVGYSLLLRASNGARPRNPLKHPARRGLLAQRLNAPFNSLTSWAAKSGRTRFSISP